MVSRIAFALFAVLLAAAAPSGRAEFDEGRRLFLAERYAEALPHLERARELSGGRPSTIEALALCYEKLGDDKRALEQYRALRDADPERAEETNAKIGELEAKLAASAVLAPADRPRPPGEPDNFAARPTAPPPPPVTPVEAAAPPPDDEGPPWLWITVGAIAVVAASVAVVAVSTSGGEELPPSLDRRFER